MRPDQVPAVPPAQLPADAVLLDVREHDEWAAGRAPGAVHVPMGELPARLADLPAADPLYVVCRSGVRSAIVAAYLDANGWNAINVDGGMQAWHAAGRKLVSDRGEPSVL